MNNRQLKDSIAGIDIYLLDQIIKDRFQRGEKILDAGCGKGRNLKWFYNNDFEIYGIDGYLESINYCKNMYFEQKDHFKQAVVERLPFEDHSFDHVVCNAVLHFANDLNHFNEMFSELIRVLKPNGSLFIRMASNFGMEDLVQSIGDGNYMLPDGSNRFLLTSEILKELKSITGIIFIEDIKTTIVEDKRCMTTLVIRKVTHHNE